MNVLTTYFYEGDFVQDLTSTSVEINGIFYWTLCAEVVILYGNYIGADVVPSVAPRNLPPLMNVAFNAKFYRVGGGKFSAAKLVNRQDIFDADDRRNCLGTKFTFVSPVIAPGDCVTEYNLVWSTNRIEMAYGGSMIFINAQNGVTSPEMLCAI